MVQESKFAQDRKKRIILIRMIPFGQDFEHGQARFMFGLNKLVLPWIVGTPMPAKLPDQIFQALGIPEFTAPKEGAKLDVSTESPTRDVQEDCSNSKDARAQEKSEAATENTGLLENTTASLDTHKHLKTTIATLAMLLLVCVATLVVLQHTGDARRVRVAAPAPAPNPPPAPNACFGVECGDHGTCTGGTCSCESSAYSGDRCQHYDACFGVECGDHGTCTGGTCSCESSAYSGEQ